MHAQSNSRLLWQTRSCIWPRGGGGANAATKCDALTCLTFFRLAAQQVCVSEVSRQPGSPPIKAPGLELAPLGLKALLDFCGLSLSIKDSRA